MKIRKLAALCKAAKTIYLIDDNISGVQWCGDGAALYPPPDICITYAGQEFMPLSASGKVIWINPKYLDPESKSGDIELYERVGDNGLSYIAVKVGMMLEAVIYPLSMGDKLPGRLKQLGNADHYIDPRTGEVSG